MDLPTYTSIWRIEKRLYKLYDFRLPMPLPIGQVTIFAAMAVPYVVLLTLLSVPFNHTLIWLYILPPGAATWLVTRPVLESKRLPELITSQLRYLAEPRILCRMAPLAERDVMIVSGRVWRPRTDRRGARTPAADLAAAAPRAESRPAETQALPRLSQGRPAVAPAAVAGRVSVPSPTAPPARERRRPPGLGRSRAVASSAPAGAANPGALPARVVGGSDGRPPARLPSPWKPGPLPAARPVSQDRSAGPQSTWPPASSARTPAVPAAGQAGTPGQGRAAAPVSAPQMRLAASGRPAPARPATPVPESREPARGVAADPAGRREPGSVQPGQATGESGEVAAAPAGEVSAAAAAPAPAADSLAPDGSRQHAGPLPPRPVITVIGGGAARDTAPAVERALAGPSARRGDVRAGRVTVVPGGHRPGKPDLLQRDRARAQLPIGSSARIVVLGCTVGAGQTMTTLLLGDVLASLRSDRVAVIDLNPGASSLARRADARPALSQAALTGRSRLAVIAPQRAQGADQVYPMGPPGGPRDPGVDAITLEAATGQHDLVLADPATVAVPRLLAIADQLVLVAPASGAAPGAIVMTFEWLDAHGRADLAAESIMVLNGVSRRSVSHVEQAERVCTGRCRAIVRVPWDDQLQNQTAKRIHSPAPGSEARQQWAGVLGPATASAYTALAGVLVASLAGQGQGTGREHEPVPAGQAEP